MKTPTIYYNQGAKYYLARRPSDGAVTLFKPTDEGTETIAVFDEEHREVIQDLLTEIKRLRKGIKHVITYENTFLEGVPYIVKYLKELIAEQEREE